MRLIDADALKEKVKKYHDMEDGHDGISEGREGALYDTLIDIDNAPTIDAIPVEWLLKWIKTLQEGAYVRDIIHDWRKEQEADNG